MERFRTEFCRTTDKTLQKLEKHSQILKETIRSLDNEINAINDLIKELPEFSCELNDLCETKITEYAKVKSKK